MSVYVVSRSASKQDPGVMRDPRLTAHGDVYVLIPCCVDAVCGLAPRFQIGMSIGVGRLLGEKTDAHQQQFDPLALSMQPPASNGDPRCDPRSRSRAQPMAGASAHRQRKRPLASAQGRRRCPQASVRAAYRAIGASNPTNARCSSGIRRVLSDGRVRLPPRARQRQHLADLVLVNAVHAHA